jgi:hypothetical protein
VCVPQNPTAGVATDKIPMLLGQAQQLPPNFRMQCEICRLMVQLQVTTLLPNQLHSVCSKAYCAKATGAIDILNKQLHPPVEKEIEVIAIWETMTTDDCHFGF